LDRYAVGINSPARPLYITANVPATRIVSRDSGSTLTALDASTNFSETLEPMRVTWEGSDKIVYYGSTIESGVYGGNWSVGDIGIGNLGSSNASQWNGLIRFIKITNAAEPPS
jgi:hypothetical protein